MSTMFGDPVVKGNPVGGSSTMFGDPVSNTPDASVSNTPSKDDFGNQLVSAAKNFWQQANPVNMVTGMAQAAAHPLDTFDSYLKSNNDMYEKAKSAYASGDYPTAMRHALGFLLNAVPGVGSTIDSAGDQAASGDVGGALGKTAGLATNLYVGSKLPQIAETGTNIVKAIPQATRTTGQVIKAGARAAAPDIGIGAAKAGVGYGISEAMPKSPVSEIGRWAMMYPGARQIMEGIGKGIEAGRSVLSAPGQVIPPDVRIPPIRPMAQPAIPTAPIPPVRFNPQPSTDTVPPPPIRWNAPPSPVNTAAIPPVKWNTPAATTEPTGIPGVPSLEDLAARGVSRYTPPPRINPQSIAQPAAPPQVTGQSLVPPEHPYQTQLAPEAANPTKAGVATGEASRAGARTVWARGMARRLYDSGKGITAEDAATLQPTQLDPLANEAGLTPASLRSPETIQQMLQELGNLWKRGQK